MEVNKIISHALQSMPPSKRQKAFAKDTSKLIHMGLNENNYGMSPKAVAALEGAQATWMDSRRCLFLWYSDEK